MTALPATKIESPSRKRSTKKSKATAKAKKANNVINLDSRRAKAPLTDEQRQELVLEFRIKARKLGRSILRKWHARMDLEEVDSIVDLSLCEAVKRFDPNKGASFITFLYYHLRGNLIRAVSAAASANAMPVAGPEADSYAPTGPDAGKRYAHRGINAIEIAEALNGNDVELPDQMILKREIVEISQHATNCLDDLERLVIRKIFLEEQQLMDVANELGYSRCHISRVKKKALENLHREMTRVKGEAREPETFIAPVAEKSDAASRRKVYRRRPRSRKAREARMKKAA